jgi:phenylpyruvate tautomerase PptA (4-oxalocrotonate tautomerase family)
MPTYVCYLPSGAYDTSQKARIAKAISRRHSEDTGAPPYFVQVQIEESKMDRFLGGQLTHTHIWVRGDIRAGRTPDQRTSLMLNIMQDISEITGLNEDNIWVYLCNLAPTDMSTAMCSLLQVKKNNGSPTCHLGCASILSL